MLTEEQAREKDCRQPGQWGGLKCSASGCMAWQWAKPAMITRRVYEDTPEAAALRKARLKNPADTFFAFDSATWRYEFTSSDSRGKFDQLVRSPDEDAAPTHGYCGAFGRPGDAP